MKKQNLDGKLSLQRETLVPLQAAELHDVNGGTWGQVVKATIRYCTTVTVVVSHPIVTCKK
jgi:hypothetical protein